MLKISKKTEYALMAIKFMASLGPEKKTSAREICQYFNIPFDPTAKVLQILHHHEIVVSTQGVKGGYILAKPLDQVSYFDLHHMIEGKKEDWTICHNTKGVCDHFTNCQIQDPLFHLDELIQGFLKNINLKELLLTQERTLKS